MRYKYSRPSLTTLTFMLCTWFLFSQCQKKDVTQLHGAWKVDSVYSFYNGFNMMSPGAEPHYHFQEDGRLRMTLDKEFRYFNYELRNDSLHYHSNDNRVEEKFLILELDENHLTLKKTKSPLFKQNNQERYEIKYLSKIKE